MFLLIGNQIFLLIIVLLMIIPIITAQFNYKINAVKAQTFSTYTLDGYIQNQGAAKVFKYGFNTSDNSGCGWIATYNALTYLYNKGLINYDPKVEDVIRPLDSFASFGYGYLGTNPLVMKLLLQSKGLKVDIITNKNKFEQSAKDADINIIVYLGKHLTYGHYQMMEYDSVGDDFVFYTPSYHVKMDEYLEEHENDYTFLLAISI